MMKWLRRGAVILAAGYLAHFTAVAVAMHQPPERFGLFMKHMPPALVWGPALLDDPDNRVERAYTAWPDRLYVIDKDGRIAYKSAAGPFGFKPARVEETLKRILTATAGEVVPGGTRAP